MSHRRSRGPGAVHEPPVPYRAASPSPPLEARGQLTCLDLFCGCGGFTLGMQRAGYRILAAIDFNPEAIATLRQNLPDVPFALCEDLTVFPPKKLARLLAGASGTHVQPSIDVIVGGPPCQGFSRARQADGSNHGPRLKPDERRHLYREFLRYVEHFQPRVFVMENVLGLRNAAGGAYFTAVQKEARALGYRVHGQIEDAWELGAPQKRRRQLIVGVRHDLPGYFIPDLKPAPRAEPRTWLWAAIGDLPILRAGGGEDERDYDFPRRMAHVDQQGRTVVNYLDNVLEIDRAAKLTNHVARPHSDRDLRDFALLKEGENSAVAMRERGVQFEFPYDKTCFKDRYTRQSRWHPCSTIVAHLSKDGLMFIHPTQNRSLTPREAARIQSFPDWFRFPAARTHAFRLIGNAVPPLVAEAVGLAVKDFLGSTAAPAVPAGACAGRNREDSVAASEMFGEGAEHNARGGRAPHSRPAAARALERLANLDRRGLRALSKADFLYGWHALLFLFPGLHPDNALDHGGDIEEVPIEQLGLPGFEQELARRHARSGWPVALELIGREAWRRVERNEITNDELYCAEAQRAGLTAGAQTAPLATQGETA